MCQTNDRLTNQKYMLSGYYTNYVTIMKIPLIGNGMKNKVVLPYGLLCFMLFVLTHALAQSPHDRGAAGGHPKMRSSRELLDLEKAIKVIPKQRLQESRTIKYPDYDADRYPILEYTIDTRSEEHTSELQSREN